MVDSFMKGFRRSAIQSGPLLIQARKALSLSRAASRAAGAYLRKPEDCRTARGPGGSLGCKNWRVFPGLCGFEERPRGTVAFLVSPCFLRVRFLCACVLSFSEFWGPP